MDVLVSSAVDEIAAEGVNGCSLPTLWQLLEVCAQEIGLELDIWVKQSIWQNLLEIPVIRVLIGVAVEGSKLIDVKNMFDEGLIVPQAYSSMFELKKNSDLIQSVEEAEGLCGAGVLLLASKEAQAFAAGLYDQVHTDSFKLSSVMRETLSRVARARTKGLIQADLAKQLGVQNNNFFYILKNLESLGLITRHSLLATDKKKAKQTNIIHLSRYSNMFENFGDQQRFVKSLHVPKPFQLSGYGDDPVSLVDDEEGTSIEVSDDEPALREIVRILDESEKKILLRSELKVKFNYRETAGHRNWRRIEKKLVDSGFIEVKDHNIDGKVMTCVKLLKPYNGGELVFTGIKSSNRAELGVDEVLGVELVAELPAEQQVFSMIHNAGQEGIHMAQVWKRLGLNGKRYDYIKDKLKEQTLIAQEAETHNRSTVYRVRSLLAFRALYGIDEEMKPLDSRASEVPGDFDENEESGEVVVVEGGGNFLAEQAAGQVPHGKLTVRRMPESSNDIQGPSFTDQEEATDFKDSVATSAVAWEQGPEQQLETVPKEKQVDIYQPKKRASFPLDKKKNFEREKAVFEFLNERKWGLRHEIRSFVTSKEPSDKPLPDRKTIDRLFFKLCNEGKISIHKISVPGTRNGGQEKLVDLILLPSVKMSQELVQEIYQRNRELDKQMRPGNKSRKAENLAGEVLPTLNSIEHLTNADEPDDEETEEESRERRSVDDPFSLLRKNGFVVAKMVKVRMFHFFLVSFVQSENQVSSQGFQSFSMGDALLHMPLQLFLQIVGCNSELGDLTERCAESCAIIDLAPHQQDLLLSATRTNSQISRMLDILERLKLVRMDLGNQNTSETTSLVYVLEENGFLFQPSVPFGLESSRDDSAMEYNRYDFDLRTDSGLKEYWSTLEYTYTKLDKEHTKLSFPGNVLSDLCVSKTWSAGMVMSITQRQELLNRLKEIQPGGKNNAVQIAQIAEDVGVSVEQVTKLMYSRNQSLKHQISANYRGRKRLRKSIMGNVDTVTGFTGIPELDGSNQMDMDPNDCFEKLVQKDAPKSGLFQTEDDDVHVNIDDDYEELELEPMAKRKEAENSHGGIAVTENQEEVVDAAIDAGAVGGGENIEMTENDADEETEAEIKSFSHVRKRAPRVQWNEERDRQTLSVYGVFVAQYRKMQWVDPEVRRSIPFQPEHCRRRLSTMRLDPRTRMAISEFVQLLRDRYRQFTAWKRAKLVLDSKVDPSTAGEPATSQALDLSKIGRQIRVEQRETVSLPEWDPVWEWNDLCHPAVADSLEKIIKIHSQVRSWMNKPRTLKNRLLSQEKTAAQSSESKQQSEQEKETSETEAKSQMFSEVANEAGRGIAASEALTAVQSSPRIATAVELIKAVLLNSTPEREYSRGLISALRNFETPETNMAFTFLQETGLVVKQKEKDRERDSREYLLSSRFFDFSKNLLFSPMLGTDITEGNSWLADEEEGWHYVPEQSRTGHILSTLSRVINGDLEIDPVIPKNGLGEPLEGPQKRGGRGESFGRRIRGFPGIEVRLRRKAEVGTSTDMEKVSAMSETERSLNGPQRQLLNQKSVSEIFEEQIATQFAGTVLQSQESKTRAAIDVFNQFLRGRGTDPDHSLVQSCVDTLMNGLEKTVGVGLSVDEAVGLLEQNGAPLNTKEIEACFLSLCAFGLAFEVNAFDHKRFVSEGHSECFFVKVGRGSDSVDKKTEKSSHSGSDFANVPGQKSMETEQASSEAMTMATTEKPTGEQSAGSAEGQEKSNEPNLDSIAAAQSSGNQSMEAKNSRVNSWLKRVKIQGAEFVGIYPWLMGNGSSNDKFVKGIVRKIIGAVFLNPGVPEELILPKVEVLNPQTCLDLLDLLEKRDIFRVELTQNDPAPVPFPVVDLTGQQRPESIKHYFLASKALEFA